MRIWQRSLRIQEALFESIGDERALEQLLIIQKLVDDLQCWINRRLRILEKKDSKI